MPLRSKPRNADSVKKQLNKVGLVDLLITAANNTINASNPIRKNECDIWVDGQPGDICIVIDYPKAKTATGRAQTSFNVRPGNPVTVASIKLTAQQAMAITQHTSGS